MFHCIKRDDTYVYYIYSLRLELIPKVFGCVCNLQKAMDALLQIIRVPVVFVGCMLGSYIHIFTYCACGVLICYGVSMQVHCCVVSKQT